MKEIKRNELLMIFGRWTSKLGNIVFDYANSVLLVQMFRTNSTVLAIYQSSESIISVLFNLIGGASADRESKKRILVVTDILSGIVCLTVAILVKSKKIALMMIIANVILSVINAFNSPTYKSIVKEITNLERIKKFNSQLNAGVECMQICGPIVGAFLVKIIGVKGALLFDAMTFFLSAIGELFLVIEAEYNIGKKKQSLLAAISEGFVYLLSEKKILMAIIISSLMNFFLAGYNLLIPYTDIMYEGVIDNFYAKLLIIQSFGGILGSVISTKIKNESVMLTNLFLLIIGLMITIIPVFSLGKNIFIMIFPFFIFAMTVTIYNIRFVTYIQVNVDDAYVARVFSIISTVAIVFVPMGSFVFSQICSTLSDFSFIKVGVGIIILSIISILFNK